MAPIEGRGVVAYLGQPPRAARGLHRDARCRTSCAPDSPNVSASITAQIRVISPDVGGGFGYKGILLPEEVCARAG